MLVDHACDDDEAHTLMRLVVKTQGHALTNPAVIGGAPRANRDKQHTAIRIMPDVDRALGGLWQWVTERAEILCQRLTYLHFLWDRCQAVCRQRVDKAHWDARTALRADVSCGSRLKSDRAPLSNHADGPLR